MATFPKSKSKKSDSEKTKALLKKQSATKLKVALAKTEPSAAVRFVDLVSLAFKLNAELVRKRVSFELVYDTEDMFSTSGCGLGIQLDFPTVDAKNEFDGSDRTVVVNVNSQEAAYDDVIEDLNKLLKGEANEQDKQNRKDAALRKLSAEERELIGQAHWRDPATSNPTRGF